MGIALENKPTSLRLQFLFLLLSRGLGSVLQAILVIIFARLAGVESMGLVAIATGAMSMLLSLAEFGMGPLLSRSRALGDHKLVNSILRANVVSTLLFSVVGSVALLVYLDASSLPLIVAALAISIGIEKNTDVFLNIPIADGRKWVPAFSVVLRRFTSLAAFLSMALLDLDILFAYVVSIVIGSLVGQVHVGFYREKSSRSSVGYTPFRKLMRIVTPFGLSNVAAQSRTLDTVIVGAVASVSAAGLYSAGMKLTNPLSLIASSLTSVVMPYASRGGKAYATRLGRRLVYIAIGSLVLVLPAAVFSEQIIVFILGEEYSSAAGAFMGGVMALPFLSLSPPLGSILQSQGHQRYVAVNGIAFSIVTLTFIAIGAAVWGGAGASMGLAVAFMLKCLSLWLRLMFFSAIGKQ